MLQAQHSSRLKTTWTVATFQNSRKKLTSRRWRKHVANQRNWVTWQKRGSGYRARQKLLLMGGEVEYTIVAILRDPRGRSQSLWQLSRCFFSTIKDSEGELIPVRKFSVLTSYWFFSPMHSTVYFKCPFPPFMHCAPRFEFRVTRNYWNPRDNTQEHFIITFSQAVLYIYF